MPLFDFRFDLWHLPRTILALEHNLLFLHHLPDAILRFLAPQHPALSLPFYRMHRDAHSSAAAAAAAVSMDALCRGPQGEALCRSVALAGLRLRRLLWEMLRLRQPLRTGQLLSRLHWIVADLDTTTLTVLSPWDPPAADAVRFGAPCETCHEL
jgi:hypothetical protein